MHKVSVYFICLLLFGCSNHNVHTYQDMENTLKEQYEQTKEKNKNTVTNKAGTLGMYWNWKSGIHGGLLSSHLFNIDNRLFKYSIDNFEPDTTPFLGLDSEIQYVPLNSLLTKSKEASSILMDSEQEAGKKITNLKKRYPFGVFIVTAYGQTIESVSNDMTSVLIAQDGNKLISKDFQGIANIPDNTGLWWNSTVISLPKINISKPFILRVYRQSDNRNTTFRFSPTQK